MPMPDRSGMDVRHYLNVLRRRKWVVILSVFVVTASALTFSLLQAPVYESHARVLIEPNRSLFDTGSDLIDQARIETEIQVLLSDPVKTVVRERLGSVPPVSAYAVGTTAVVEVAAESTSPVEAAEAADAYTSAYVDYRRQKAIDGLLAATNELQQKISDLDGRIADANARALATNPPRENAFAPPTPEQQALEGQRAAFKLKFDQLQVDVALKNGGSQVVGPAEVPTDPVRPTPVRNALLGVLVGLIVGIGLAFVFDQLDDTLKTREDIQRTAGTVPVVGVIPRMTGWKNKSEPRLVSLTDPTSQAAEAYRTLRTSIQFIGVDRSMRTLQVTSPTSGDGKTTTIANLAVALGRAGQRVTVMSCDLRRPRIHEFFNLSNTVGFTSVLVGDASLAAALQDVEGDVQVRVLASGPTPPNPSELLSSQRAAQVIKALAAQCDVVLIDCPPVLPVTDAAVLSSQVDGTLVVATAGTTTGKQLHRALELLRQVDAPLVGLVMNAAPPEDAYGYGYGYYRSEESPRKVLQPSANGGTNGSRQAKGSGAHTPVEPSSS